MRIKEFFYMLGFKPKPQKYGYKINTFDLAKEGKIEYAQWLNPSEGTKSITQGQVDELKKFLSPGDVAIDIGAQTGDTTLPISLAVGHEGCVFALEPNKYVYPILEKNSTLNENKTKIIPLMFAATKDDCKISFQYSSQRFCNGGYHEGISKWKHGHFFDLEVEGKNLEKFLRREYKNLISRIKYIKIDAEGYDCSIVKSISGIIEESRPFLMIEVFKNLNRIQRNELLQTITNFGYSLLYKVESVYNYCGTLLDKNNFFIQNHFDMFCIPKISGFDGTKK